MKKEFLEFAAKLKELEDDKRKKYHFCKEHNFKHEEEWLRNEYNLIQGIRFEMENVANGHWKPSEAKFVF